MSRVDTIFVWSTTAFTATSCCMGFLWALLRERRTGVRDGVLGLALIFLALAALLIFSYVFSSGDIIGVAALLAYFGLSRLWRMSRSPRKDDYKSEPIK